MKFYKAFRASYWSSADWTYKFKNKTKRKFYTIDEMVIELDMPKPLIDVVLNNLQDIIYFPSDVTHSVDVFINNKYKTKTHVLTSNLSVGEWHEFSERIEIVISDSFINWMETEYCGSSKPSPEKLLEKHLWEVNLKLDNGMFIEVDSPLYGTPTKQATGAKTLFEIYQYFKYQRPSIVKYSEDTYADNHDVWFSDQLYEELDTKYLNMIIENRMSMWT